MSMSSVLCTDWKLHQWSINLDLISYCVGINFKGHIIPEESSKRGPWNTELLRWPYRVCSVYNAIVYNSILFLGSLIIWFIGYVLIIEVFHSLVYTPSSSCTSLLLLLLGIVVLVIPAMKLSMLSTSAAISCTHHSSDTLCHACQLGRNIWLPFLFLHPVLLSVST